MKKKLKQVISVLFFCCKHECKKKESFLLTGILIHALVHIVVALLLIIYVPNKTFLLIVATLDAISHYAAITGLVGFAVVKIKKLLKHYLS